MRIQTRDRRLMRLLATYGVLSSEQVRRLCFEGIANTTALRRLRLLESEGMILRVNGLPNAMSAFGLSRDGAKVLGLDAPLIYRNKNTLLHDVMLSELRLALESIEIGQDFTSEQELKRRLSWQRGSGFSAGCIPDGIFVVKKNFENKVVALELELTPKGHLRYKNVFSQYARKSSLSYVWYVVADASILRLVFKMWEKIKKYPTSPELLISLLPDLITNPSQAKLSDGKGESALITEFFCSRLDAQGAQALSSLKDKNQTDLRVKNFNQNQIIPSAPAG